jgi:hypothetical protein
MQLRNHPLMTRKSGLKTWPPNWTTTHRNRDEKPIGEVGTLEDVMMSDLIANEVFMWIQWEDVQYMGFLSFDDLTFRSQIGTLLKANIGRSIEEIGDLDLSSIL